MKKVVSLVLALVMCLSLCGCGKSQGVQNAEEKIAALSENSTYEEIHNAYEAYNALNSEQKKKVENTEQLAEYCDISSGKLALTGALLEEVKGKFEKESIYTPAKAISEVQTYFYLSKNSRGWNDYGKIEVTKKQKVDDYTYSGYGSIVIEDNYGAVSTYKFRINYYATYEASGYEISSTVAIFKN